MQTRPLKGHVSFTPVALAATIDGDVYSASYDKNSADFKTGQYESAMFLVTLDASVATTELLFDIQESSDNATFANVLRDSKDSNSVISKSVTPANDAIYQYHFSLNEVDRYFRLRVHADAVETIKVELMLYNGKFPVVESF